MGGDGKRNAGGGGGCKGMYTPLVSVCLFCAQVCTFSPERDEVTTKNVIKLSEEGEARRELVCRSPENIEKAKGET